MAYKSSMERDMFDELGLTGMECNTSSSSEEEISEEIIHRRQEHGEDQEKLKQIIEQTKSELRVAQSTLANSEHGKENRFKILRKTHQSALSLKQSLIQELQDIITEKDEYIRMLEERLTGNQSEIERPKDNGLSKIVAMFSKLSKEYVDLQSQHERAKEELNHQECKRQKILVKSDTSMMKEIKQLQEKLALLEKKDQEYLQLKNTNTILCNKIKDLENKILHLEATSSQKKTECGNLMDQITLLKERIHRTEESRSSVDYKSLLQENVKLNSECTGLKLMLHEKNEKIQLMTEQLSILERSLESQRLHSMELSDQLKGVNSNEGDPSKMKECLQPVVSNISRLVKVMRNHIVMATNSVQQLNDTMNDEFSQVTQSLCQALFGVYGRSSKLRRKYLQEMKQRKELHNQLIELKGNIRVFCRVRPLIIEDGSGCDSSIVVHPDKDDDSLIHVQNHGNYNKIFEVDKVFGPDSTQQEVFSEVQPLITSCIDGYNVCIFAYGQTGSGKTFTMEGSVENPGINQLALLDLFTKIKSSESDWSYSVLVSMLEIYNEAIHDLLSIDSESKLDIRLKSDGFYVPGLTQIAVSSLDEVNTVFSLGHKNRSTAATKMNLCSSRSHALLCVSVLGHNINNGIKTFGKLTLVDLAGSERLHKSGSTGVRMQEVKHINKSLSSLADVIYNLRTKSRHIPYRNSKLTFLLQDSLGGDSKTLMIVQLSPVQRNSSETVCSLNFAQRVRAVELGEASKKVSRDI